MNGKRDATGGALSDSVREAMATSLRGCDELLVQAEWLARLVDSERTGMPLRIKLGLDPTAPDLHFGIRSLLDRCASFRTWVTW